MAPSTVVDKMSMLPETDRAFVGSKQGTQAENIKKGAVKHGCCFPLETYHP